MSVPEVASLQTEQLSRGPLVVKCKVIGSQPPFLWTRGIAARETLQYLEREGINAGPLLLRAGLARGQLMQDPGGVSVNAQHRFLELAAIEVKDPLLGFHVAADLDLRDIGLLYYLASASRTVAEALEYLKRYSATANEEIRLEIVPRGEETVLIFRRMVMLDELPQQHSELIALAFIRVLHALANQDFVPLRMTFTHNRSSGLREAHRILRCPIEFGQVMDSWIFSESVMQLRIVSADSCLLQILETHADHLLAQKDIAIGLQGLVENTLLDILPSGRVQAAAIAEQLGMSMRSFSRRLAREGTTFGDVLDKPRQRLAFRYLQDSRISLQQIAWLLRYSEVGAFNHASKRWTGTSPGRVRNSSLSTPGFMREAPGADRIQSSATS